MLKKISLIFLLFLIQPLLYAAECVLNDVSASPIHEFTNNMDVLMEAVEDAAQSSKCVRGSGEPEYFGNIYIINSIESLLLTIHSVGFNLASLLSDTRYYFDTGGTMLLPVFQQHEKLILDLQKKITDTGTAVGNLCAQGVVKFDYDVEIDGAKYNTKGFNLEEILAEMYLETTHLMIFYRNLATNISDREYIDETNFPIAPSGFALKMREYYSSKNIQVCHDEDPKNVQIKEVLKEAFITGWKYPQAIQIWKEAFALLLYRGEQIFGGGETDEAKEAEILKIVESQKGGLSNSRILNGKTLTDEFKRNPKNQTIREQASETLRRIGYQTFGRLFNRQVVPDVAKENKNLNSVVAPTFPQNDANATKLAKIDKENYADYADRNLRVGQDKGRNQDLGVGLVDALNEIQGMSALLREMAQIICEIYAKQGRNVQEMFGIADCNYFFKE